MSGNTKPAPAPGDGRLGVPAAPFRAPIAGDIDQRLAIIADAINRKADVGSEVMHPWLLLVDQNGIAWRLWVDTGGVVRTTEVVRT